MKTGLLFAFLSIVSIGISQISDHFSDGDFSANPAWTGSTNDFVVNAAGQLQLNNTIAGVSWLSLPHNLETDSVVEWRIWIRQNFAPSGSNFGRFYLSATADDLSTYPDGYYLQFGESGSGDAVRLIKTIGGTDVELCAGAAGQIASPFTLGIRVVRNADGLWSIYTDATGGTNYLLQATFDDPSVLPGTHCGVLANYTISNSTKFFFDDIFAGGEIIDSSPPAITSIFATDSQHVDVRFTEGIAGFQASSSSNYALSPAVPVQSAAIDGSDPTLLHLELSSGMINGQQYTLTITSIEDFGGNVATNASGTFHYLVSDEPQTGDIIFTEFMCDPGPVVALPEAEYIEIYNKSTRYFDLTGWKLGDASGFGTIVSGWIMPGEYKILCASGNISHFLNSLAVSSFPSFNNSADNLILKTPDSLIVDLISYTDNWYRNPEKQDGGYSIERINPNDPCSDSLNWMASVAISGGTPGVQNSVHDTSPDTATPVILSTLAISPDQVVIVFSEGMDSTQLNNASFAISPTLNLADRTIFGAWPNEITLRFADTLTANLLYQFTIDQVSDCWLNSTSLSGSFALADIPLPNDLVINELLFDPATGGSDFIELYNRSAKIFDLFGMSLAKYGDDTIANHQIFPTHFLLEPGGYLALTPDVNFQVTQFAGAVVDRIQQVELPALDNDSSTLYLLDANNYVIDKVSYNENWHLSLIDDTENKSLERIDPNGPANESSNWHTAAEPIGFGTPGGRNSQFLSGEIAGDFGALQPLFSPDNDGFEDVLQLYYHMGQPGMIATLGIYDDEGRLVRTLASNELLGIEGRFMWDGTSAEQQKCTVGVYIAVLEAFSAEGKLFQKRQAITLAGKLD